MRGRAFAVGAILWLCAGLAHGKPPIWTLYGARGVVVLFGSVHMLPQGVDWRPDTLTAALAKADTLWFEIPISQATDEAALRLTTRRARLPKGDTLWKHLSAPQRERVEQAARALGVDPQALAPLRPWMAELALSLADDGRAGARPSLGVESGIQNDAPAATRRRALETVGQQITFLSGGETADQVASLDETAREIVEDPRLYERTVTEWLAGDLTGLQRDDLDPLRAAAPSVYERLIAARNRRWTAQLERLAREPGLSVVVVGAGHLVGPDGVPALLRARGLRVDGP